MGKIKFLIIGLLLFLSIGQVNATNFEPSIETFSNDTIISTNENTNSLPSVITNFKTNVKKNKFELFLMCLIPGVIISTIIFLVYFFRNNMIRKSNYANNYLDNKSINITFRQDRYFGKDTSKRKK